MVLVLMRRKKIEKKEFNGKKCVSLKIIRRSRHWTMNILAKMLKSSHPLHLLPNWISSLFSALFLLLNLYVSLYCCTYWFKYIIFLHFKCLVIKRWHRYNLLKKLPVIKNDSLISAEFLPCFSFKKGKVLKYFPPSPPPFARGVYIMRKESHFVCY